MTINVSIIDLFIHNMIKHEWITQRDENTNNDEKLGCINTQIK